MTERLRDYMGEAGPSGLAAYLRTRAATPWRYVLEQLPQWLLGWVPGLPGIALRHFAYKPILGQGSSRPTIGFPAGVLFPKDGVDLTEEGKGRLRTLFDFLIKASGERINIKGFTDSDPPGAGSRYRDNWEISSLRAVAVLRYMVSLGMPPNRLTATGLADLEPLYPNDTPEHRARNQRVEFVLERWIGD